MPEHQPRQSRHEERRRRILAAARERADADGWAAVTTRHLADAIGYTQPVLYSHFPGGKAQIMLAIAMDGFAELNSRCRTALGREHGRAAVEAVAVAYLEFGRQHPAVYEAMFQQAIDTVFASEETEPALRAAFETLSQTIDDDGAATEVFWSALHGMSQLERFGRMLPEHRPQRITDLVARFAPEPTASRLS